MKYESSITYHSKGMPNVKVFDEKKRKQKYDNNNPVIDYGSSQYAGLHPPSF